MKLYLGCGEKYIPGFTHIDIRKFNHINYICSVDKLLIFEDNSIELIYACHILEHFDRYEIKKVLKEWHRVLKKDGVLRIATPDFNAVVNVYQKNKNLEEIRGLVMGGQTYKYNFHHSIFDYNSLFKLLKDVGFKKIYKYDWRQTIHKDYDDYSQAYLPHMDKENGTLMSLNIEAIK